MCQTGHSRSRKGQQAGLTSWLTQLQVSILTCYLFFCSCNKQENICFNPKIPLGLIILKYKCRVPCSESYQPGYTNQRMQFRLCTHAIAFMSWIKKRKPGVFWRDTSYDSAKTPETKICLRLTEGSALLLWVCSPYPGSWVSQTHTHTNWHIVHVWRCWYSMSEVLKSQMFISIFPNILSNHLDHISQTDFPDADVTEGVRP